MERPMADNAEFRPSGSWAVAVTALGAVVAVAAAVGLLLAPLGYRAGIWPLRFALIDLPGVYVFYAGITGAAISVIALVTTLAGIGAAGPRSPYSAS